MAVDDDLRLAWYYHSDGRFRRRDALVALALVGGLEKGADWVERGRSRLIARRPTHVFAAFPSVRHALADSEVRLALRRLRQTYPPARVRWLLRRAAAPRSPYTGRVVSFSIILDDLFGGPTPQPVEPMRRIRINSPQPQRRGTPQKVVVGAGARASGDHGGESVTQTNKLESWTRTAPDRNEPRRAAQSSRTADPGSAQLPAEATAELLNSYLNVLLSIALLLECVLRASNNETKAA
jgi:hypothetical protein